MESEIISRILRAVRPKSEEEQFPLFSDKRYKPFKLSKDNFHEINAIKSEKKVVFIDGGNNEIIAGADFSLHFARIYCTVYLNNKRIKSKRKEFYILVSAFAEGSEIFYKAEIFPESAATLGKSYLLFNSFDRTIREGNNRIKISKIGEIIRRFYEIKSAAEITEELGDGDIIVRDGSLQATVTNENLLFDELYEKAEKKNIIVAALSKTCSLLTDKGNSLSSAIRSISPKGKWHYHPVADISSPEHKAEMFFIKLSDKSRYFFRFEVYNGIKFEINDILSILSDNSKDPTFIGYPYGLIEADKLARVSEEEGRSLRMKFIFRAGKEWEKLSEKESELNAHDLLL